MAVDELGSIMCIGAWPVVGLLRGNTRNRVHPPGLNLFFRACLTETETDCTSESRTQPRSRPRSKRDHMRMRVLGIMHGIIAEEVSVKCLQHLSPALLQEKCFRCALYLQCMIGADTIDRISYLTFRRTFLFSAQTAWWFIEYTCVPLVVGPK
jgi:hypothetical protein